MSVVTTVMIQFDALGDADRDDDIPDLPSDFKNTAKVQEIVDRLCEGQQFQELDNWGGHCFPQVDVLYGAGFNYFPTDDFLSELEKLEWAWPDRLRVFVREEDEAAFAVWTMESGKMVCVVEPGYI